MESTHNIGDIKKFAGAIIFNPKSTRDQQIVDAFEAGIQRTAFENSSPQTAPDPVDEAFEEACTLVAKQIPPSKFITTRTVRKALASVLKATQQKKTYEHPKPIDIPRKDPESAIKRTNAILITMISVLGFISHTITRQDNQKTEASASKD